MAAARADGAADGAADGGTSGAGNRLGEYLRARRALVTPEQVGLAGGSRRRVTGLRREEVALLAGVSADHLRLERGRNPSPQVLEALARVLLLDELETQYLLQLARPVPRTRSAARRRAPAQRVPPRLHHLLAALQVPAFVEGRTFDVLASNASAVAFSPRLRVGQNRLRSPPAPPTARPPVRAVPSATPASSSWSASWPWPVPASGRRGSATTCAG
nr:helix-turn-helix transcriptional regulator [Kineococcus indalonis]